MILYCNSNVKYKYCYSIIEYKAGNLIPVAVHGYEQYCRHESCMLPLCGKLKNP